LSLSIAMYAGLYCHNDLVNLERRENACAECIHEIRWNAKELRMNNDSCLCFQVVQSSRSSLTFVTIHGHTQKMISLCLPWKLERSREFVLRT
jgi:hypothetical protein